MKKCDFDTVIFFERRVRSHILKFESVYVRETTQ